LPGEASYRTLSVRQPLVGPDPAEEHTALPRPAAGGEGRGLDDNLQKPHLCSWPLSRGSRTRQGFDPPALGTSPSFFSGIPSFVFLKKYLAAALETGFEQAAIWGATAPFGLT